MGSVFKMAAGLSLTHTHTHTHTETHTHRRDSKTHLWANGASAGQNENCSM